MRPDPRAVQARPGGGQPPSEQQAGAEAITHSDRLALVDRGNRVVGYFDSTDPAKIAALVAEATRRDRRAPGVGPPAAGGQRHASTAPARCCCLLGWLLIRAGNVRGHATVHGRWPSSPRRSSSTCYLVYHYQAGSTPFRGVGPIRLVYFTILLSHTVLATFGVVPLVALTLTRALRRQFDRHARIAQVTFPIWLYVSITGVVIYLMLYQLTFRTSSLLASGN